MYVQYGYEKQSKVVYSLNHDPCHHSIFTLDGDPQEMPKSDLDPLAKKRKGVLIYQGHLLKDPKTIKYIKTWM